MRDFLAGRSNDEKVVDQEDKATREVVAAELLATMSGQTADETARENAEKSPTETQELARFNSGDGVHQQSDLEANSVAPENSENPTGQEQDRARQLFLDHGYFDETVQNLRAASSPADRAAAARALGLVGSQRATAHLIAAMFDDDAEVRSAAEEALGKIDQTGGNVSAAPANDQGKKVAESKSSESSISEREGRVPYPAEAEEAIAESAVLPEAVEITSSSGGDTETPIQLTVPAPDVPSDLIVSQSAGTSEAEQLHLEQQTIKEALADIEQQVLTAATKFAESENEVRWRTEREAKLQADAAARRLEEEELRKRAQEEAAVRRAGERAAVAAEQAARLEAEAEAQRHADEESNLRLKAASLRLDAADVARRRAELETARNEAMEAEREAEARRLRNEARSRHQSELGRLRAEEEALQRAKDEVLQQQANLRMAREKVASEIDQLKEEQLAAETAQRAEADRLRREAEKKNDEAQRQLQLELEGLRRAEAEVDKRRVEVEAAREQADVEAQRLVEAQARMRAAEEARAKAENERSQLEAEINQQVEKQIRLLEETRRRGEEEQERLREELRLRTEAEQQRLTELEAMRTRADVESKERAERQQQVLAQVDSLRIADTETRRRIEDAESRRRAADDAYRLIAEKVQRVEAEAHARAKEEERMLAKLESERRNAAIEAQARADQEKRIREEIEVFRRLEEEERPRLEEAALQLAGAEARLQERKDHLKGETEARVLAEEALTAVGEQQHSSSEQVGAAEWQEGTPAKAAPMSLDESAGSVATTSAAVLEEGANHKTANRVDGGGGSGEAADSVVTSAIATYLNSVDPYKRAAAVAELARSGSPDAFTRIADCFDDYSPHVRNAAARALRKLEPDKAVDLFNRALEQASPERRRNIGAAIAASGLATEAINNLASESREDTYNALSILFVMAKTGEVDPLVRALEEHPDDEIGKAVSKLLSLSGHQGGERAAGGGAQ